MKTFFYYLIYLVCVIACPATANELIAVGLAEKHADAVAHDNITAYEHSMYCKFSDKNASVPYGEQLALPDDEYMRQLRAEYIDLAYKIKRQKDSLDQEFDLDTVLPINASELYTYEPQNTNRKHIYATAAERVNNSDADKKIKAGIRTLMATTATTAIAGALVQSEPKIPENTNVTPAINQDVPQEQDSEQEPPAPENVASADVQDAQQDSIDELCAEFPDEPECSE